MKFIENEKMIDKEQSEESKKCKHEIVKAKFLIGDTRYRYCKHCGMVAHEDGDFHNYICGFDYCRCMA